MVRADSPLQARFRQRRLAIRALHKLRHDGFNAVGNVAQETPLLATAKACRR